MGGKGEDMLITPILQSRKCAEAGVSVLFTVLKMDAGPVLRQVKRPLQGDEKVRSDDQRDQKPKTSLVQPIHQY